MAENKELKFSDLEETTNIDEISNEVLKDLDENVFESDVDTEITKKAHLIDANGEVFPIED